MNGKTNETPALRSYVETIELKDAVLTADAAHTCRATAQAVIDSGGHYVLYVKGNQPTLFGRIAEILLTGPDAGHAGELHAWREPDTGASPGGCCAPLPPTPWTSPARSR